MTAGGSPSESGPTAGEAFEPAAVPRRAGRWWLLEGGLLLAAWCLTGLYVVRGDEIGVVRVCGRPERTADGSILLQPAGLHWHLPWPLATVDRARVSEVRTVTAGSAEPDGVEAGGFLRLANGAGTELLPTGDRNLLHVQLHVHYRVDRENVADWLYGSTSVEPRLRLLAESLLADVVLRSGVDFVHTLGHVDIRREILERLRNVAAWQHLGVEVEDVTVAGATPPLRVKSEFLDVMNARADRETSINLARAYAEQRHADAQAASSRLLDQAASERLRRTDLASAEASSFNRLIDQLDKTSESGPLARGQVRQLVLQQRYMETIQEVYRNVKGKVFVDSGQPVDITIRRSPTGQ